MSHVNALNIPIAPGLGFPRARTLSNDTLDVLIYYIFIDIVYI